MREQEGVNSSSSFLLLLLFCPSRTAAMQTRPSVPFLGKARRRKRGRREGGTGRSMADLPPAAFGLETHPEVNEALLDLLRDAREAGTANCDKDLFEVIEFQEVRDRVFVLGGGRGGKRGGGRGGNVVVVRGAGGRRWGSYP